MILGENGEKMSKSRGNVVNPDDIIREYGADTMRLYEMFIGDFEKSAPWSTSSIKGCKRFLEKVWGLQDCLTEGDAYRPELETVFHRTIKKVSEDIESMKFNTAIAAMMALLNDITDTGTINRREYTDFITLLNPFAPHITEEIYHQLGNSGLLAKAAWVRYYPAKCVEDTVEVAVQVNGKLRGKINLATGVSKEAAIAVAKADAKIAGVLNGKIIVKEIYVPGKIINIVVK